MKPTKSKERRHSMDNTIEHEIILEGLKSLLAKAIISGKRTLKQVEAALITKRSS